MPHGVFALLLSCCWVVIVFSNDFVCVWILRSITFAYYLGKRCTECLGNIKWNLIKSQQCGSLRPVIIILFLFPQTCNFNHLGWPRISTGTPYVDGDYCKQGVLLIDNVSTPRRSQMCSPARLPEWLWQRWHSWIDIVWLTWGGLSEEN